MSDNNYPVSDLLLEVLNSTAKTRISREEFIFTAPQQAGEKGEASITITPLAKTTHYGVATITYFRHNLTTRAPFDLRYGGEKTIFELLERIKDIRIFKYFVWDKEHTGVESRFLRLRERDFEDKEIGLIEETKIINVPCRLDSEIFQGSINIRLLV